MGFLCGTHFRGFLYFWRKWIFIADCILYRGNIHSAECERESDRAASDDYFQPAIWDHLLFFSYYGEMMTYLGMTMPMAAFALVTWLRHPYKGNHSEVQVNTLTKKEMVIMFFPAVVITAVFYVILNYFHTANIVPSTISVTTSFLAVYLTFRRSPYFGLAYAANDVVLIILWTLASIYDKRYIAVTVCFAAFLINDIYGFISWQKMKVKQNNVEDLLDFS